MDLDTLLDRAVAVARDAACGEDVLEPMLILLGLGRPPEVLFLEGEHDCLDQLHAVARARGARRYLMITPAALQMPGVPPEDLVRVAVHAADGELATLFSIQRVDGRIVALHDLPAPLKDLYSSQHATSC